MLNKKKFEQDLKKAIKESSEPAADKALRAMFTNNEEDLSNSLGQVNAEVDKKIKEFAKLFSDHLSKELSKSMANIVDAYIKSASININSVSVPGTTVLTSPMGPVSGTINIIDKFIKIS